MPNLKLSADDIAYTALTSSVQFSQIRTFMATESVYSEELLGKVIQFFKRSVSTSMI